MKFLLLCINRNKLMTFRQIQTVKDSPGPLPLQVYNWEKTVGHAQDMLEGLHLPAGLEALGDQTESRRRLLEKIMHGFLCPSCCHCDPDQSERLKEIMNKWENTTNKHTRVHSKDLKISDYSCNVTGSKISFFFFPFFKNHSLTAACRLHSK